MSENNVWEFKLPRNTLLIAVLSNFVSIYMYNVTIDIVTLYHNFAIMSRYIMSRYIASRYIIINKIELCIKTRVKILWQV